MNYPITANITAKCAAKLLLLGELDLSSNIPLDQACVIFKELMLLSEKDLLSIVDCSRYGNEADVKYIPQFGKIETIIEVPTYFEKYGSRCADYAQMGFYLKNDLNATLSANTKFGENHSKVASLLGLVDCHEGRICPTVFTSAFCTFSEADQLKILNKLFFRVPIIQILLRSAARESVNGYSPMSQLMLSTKIRRGSSVKSILTYIRDITAPELTVRLDNIYWKEE